MRNSSEFNKHKDALTKFLFSTKTTKSYSNLEIEQAEIVRLQKNDQSITSIRSSVIYVLNYYEYMCAAYNSNSLDRTLIEQSQRGFIVGYRAKFSSFIDEERTDYQGNKEDRVFKNLIIVADSLK
jgi:Domain of unknown function (DUF4760)